MIIDDYLAYQDEYRVKYGENTIILMQVGSFFELYSIIENCQFLYKIGDICNIQISRKNKTIKEVSKNNPLMAGFPLYVLNKFVQILLQQNFTIVLIEQTTPPPNPERKITEIVSPSTNINMTSKKSNYIMVFYFEVINGLLVVGVSGVDLTTGKSFIYENGSSKSDPQYTLDECYRLITTYNPSEILLLSDEITDDYKNQITNVINSGCFLIHKKWDKYELNTHIKKLEYQNKILEKSFENKTMLSIIEYLNLEKYMIGRLSFCCLLQFAYEHNADIIKELNIPELIENSKILTIEYNSALQLNIISNSNNNNEKPLLDLLNNCATAFGSRGFKERLLNPINNKYELITRYNKIEELLKDNSYKVIIKNLKNIIDLERIKRKILLKKVQPSEWGSIINSLEFAIEAFAIIGDTETIEMITVLIEQLKILNIEECSKYNINDIKTNIFINGYCKEADDLNDIYISKLEHLNSFITKISKIDDSACKLECNDREGYYISITKKRYENALKKDKTYMNKFEKKLTTTNNSYKLTSNDIRETSAIIENTQNEIQTIIIKEYLKFLEIFFNSDKNNKNYFDIIIKNLTELDINTCNAKNAFDYCYYKPTIDLTTNNSFITTEGLRHPIIEKVITDVEYIGNDCSLHQNGILLFGINASGKSSFMKAIGLSIIMAQAGMYVPATKFHYYPYNHIMTRICGNDNIYKGMSSFVVEMTELRNILQRADSNSLIIGDEICCGTEAISGVCIVSSAINELLNKKASFIFTSHLHELTSISIIKDKIDLDKLRIYHMHIEIVDNKIIYERKLKTGQGSNIYGIDVCKSLDMPLSFMNNAEMIRKELQGLTNTIISTKNSNYNSGIYMDICEVCKINKAKETHHINYQINADDNGKFSNFNKNNTHNLVCICEECHQKEHQGEIGIIGYKQTSEGKVLEVDKKARIFKLIKRGKREWFYKKKISDKFQAITEEELIKFYNKQTKGAIKEISVEMEQLFFDSSL